MGNAPNKRKVHLVPPPRPPVAVVSSPDPTGLYAVLDRGGSPARYIQQYRLWRRFQVADPNAILLRMNKIGLPSARVRINTRVYCISRF